jgi:hypothetical protein
MVENDPSVMDLLQGRVIDALGILKEQRASGDLELAEMLEIRDFVQAEIDQECKHAKKHGNANPGYIERITAALVEELRLACGECINAGMTYSEANKKVVAVALDEFSVLDACAAMHEFLQARKKHRDAIENEVC